MPTLTMPVHLPADVLEALGEFSGHFWSDSFALEPIICDAIRAYIKPAPAAQQLPAAPSKRDTSGRKYFCRRGPGCARASAVSLISLSWRERKSNTARQRT